MFFFFIFFATLSFAGSVSLTTYYPAPFGNYDTLRLVPRSAPACHGDGANRGIMYFDTTTDSFNICGAVYNFDTGAKSIVWTPVEQFWQRNLSYPYAIIASGHEGIPVKKLMVGIRTKEPRGILDVNGGSAVDTDGDVESIYLEAESTSAAVEGGRIYFIPGSAPSMAKGGFVSIGTALNFKLFDDGGIYAKGTHGSGYDFIPVGAKTAMIWYPKKAAFRVGHASGDLWDDVNIGDYSVAMGRNSTASGTDSFAIGYNCSVSDGVGGNVAMGYGSKVEGPDSAGNIALGIDAYANGLLGAIALGNTAQATGNASVAIGPAAIASASAAIALGFSSTASGDSSIAIGGTASGLNSRTFGSGVEASTTNSMAIGRNITVSGQDSVGIGVGAAATSGTAANTFYVRGGNIDMQGSKIIISSGAGTTIANAANSLAIGQ
ncbi:MAG TPA: hypothetical protein PLH56_00005, partial [Candidatus Omnitrophota bacterium]|nr:hypothetical protein [Candidatus Omnitrophota bacterium]